MRDVCLFERTEGEVSRAENKRESDRERESERKEREERNSGGRRESVGEGTGEVQGLYVNNTYIQKKNDK